MTRYTKSMREAMEEVWANDITLDEGKMKTIATMFADGKSASEIAKKMKLPLSTVKTILGEEDIAEAMLWEFTDAQITKLKSEYAGLKGAKISLARANQLRNIFDKITNSQLPKLYKADIPFLSTMALSRMIKKGIQVPKGVRLSSFKEQTWEQLTESTKEKNANAAVQVEEGKGTIRGFVNKKEKDNMISLAKQHGLKVKDIPDGIELSGNMKKILDMQLATRSHLKTENKEWLFVEYAEYIEYMAKNSSQAKAIANMFKGKIGGGEANADGSEVRIDSAKDVESIHKQVVAKYGDDVRVLTKEQDDSAWNIAGVETSGERTPIEEKIQPYMISYSQYGKHYGFEGGDSLSDIQNKAQKLRKKGFTIDKMGRYNPPVDAKLRTGKTGVVEEKEEPKKSFADMKKKTETETKETDVDKIKLAKEKDTDTLEKQLIAAQGQINQLRTKLENEKNKAIKPMPNKETGEVPLTVGLAHKLLRDKEEKEKDKKEVKEGVQVYRVSHPSKKTWEVEGENEKEAIRRYKDEVGLKSDAGIKTLLIKDVGEDKKDPCWKDYEMIGMKKKDGKEVPNCVPKQENAPSEADLERLKKQGLKPVKEASNTSYKLVDKKTGEVIFTGNYNNVVQKDKDTGYKHKVVQEKFAVQITKKDGGKIIHGKYKDKAAADKFVKWYKTGDMKDTKSIAVVKETFKSLRNKLQEARWQIEGQLSYRGVGNYDGFHMVIDAPNERAAEQKAYKELDKARARKKIGPGGGGSVEDVDIESIERTSNRLEAPSTYKVSEYNPSVKESTPDPTKYGPDKVAKAMKIAVKSDGNYSGAVREIEKIAKDLSKVSTIARALKTANEDTEIGEACWDGYTKVGMKNKGGKQVPNCVPDKDNKIPKEKKQEEKELDERGGANTSTRQGSFARSRKPKYRFGYRVAEKEPKGEKELEEIRIRPKRAVESDLTKSQVKKVHKKADELPKKSFRDQYGKKKGDSVRYAVATNQTKKKLGIENKNHPAKKKWETLVAKKAKKESDNNTDILPKSQEPTQKTDPMNIQTKEPEKKRTDNGTKSDKIDVNPRIDYHA